MLHEISPRFQRRARKFQYLTGVRQRRTGETPTISTGSGTLPLIGGGDDEVNGFSVEWPGLRSLGVWKAPAGTEALAGKTKPDARGFGTWGTTGTT